MIHYDVGGCVICISNKAKYVDKKRSCRNSTKELSYFYLTNPPNAIENMLDKISFHDLFQTHEISLYILYIVC